MDPPWGHTNRCGKTLWEILVGNPKKRKISGVKYINVTLKFAGECEVPQMPPKE